MRTIKRDSLPLNSGKFEGVCDIADSYSEEKDKWLVELSYISGLDRLKSYYDVRNGLVASGYKSEYGLQGRMWKMALKEAFETIDKNWKTLFVRLLPLIKANNNLSDNQKHYCYWVLKDSVGNIRNLLLKLLIRR